MDLDYYESIFQRALEHYKIRLEETKEDPEIRLEKIKEDMSKHVKYLDSVINELHTVMLTGSLGEGDYRKVVCLALSCYIDDLQKSKEDTKSKINNLNIDFKLTDEEINLAQKAKNQYCPNGWDTKTNKV
jgi:uncharacterized 2Fe-2S/4Fe-4S cluster protein (DUF4445 family)